MKYFTLLLTIVFTQINHAKTFNVMAPLVIGDPSNLESSYSKSELDKFDKQLKEIKSLGAHGVSTDIWWGLIEKNENQYSWDYYKKISDLIIKNGLYWVPILSFHQCGGNVGDTCNIPIPNWLWSKYGKEAMTKSEQGNYSKEFLSVWTTKAALNEYREVMQSFKDTFSSKSFFIYEINISLGPAGELRYPSYNSHDQGAGYPTRGSIQAYSHPAILSFQKDISEKYHNIQDLNQAWGFNLSSFSDVYPPNPSLFFKKSEQWSRYGKDFYDWYSKSLRKHGKTILTEAINTFRSIPNIQIGFKVPGIHWRVAPGADRLAELNAGLISTSSNIFEDSSGHGYAKIISVATELKKELQFENLNFHFTCLEMDNFENGSYANSYAKALVFWVAQEAERQGIRILGENALAGMLYQQKSWENIQNALTYAGYDGVTFLRMGNILQSNTARRNFVELLNNN